MAKNVDAEHYEHGNGPNVGSNSRDRVTLKNEIWLHIALHWHWPCMDYHEFGLLYQEQWICLWIKLESNQ